LTPEYSLFISTLSTFYFFFIRKLAAMQLELEPQQLNVKTEAESPTNEESLPTTQSSDPSGSEDANLQVKQPVEAAKVLIPSPSPDFLHARLANYLQILANYRVHYESAYQKQILAQQLLMQNQNLSLNPNLNLFLNLILMGLRSS
jgi:hypothetical protein